MIIDLVGVIEHKANTGHISSKQEGPMQYKRQLQC